MSSGVPRDATARERIRTDLGANLCVEAGAGTGKTTVLVDRVVNLLASGTVTADQLVVITFTEKAAAELSTRTRDALERRAANAQQSERDRLLTAARDLYLAHIETIHSFATALLRERPVEAGIDPLFQVLEGVGASIDFDAAYDRFQDALLSQPLPELELALRRGFGPAELREASERLHEHRYLLPLAIPDVAADLDAVTDALAEVADELAAMLRRHQPQDDAAVPIVEGIIAWVEDFKRRPILERERIMLVGQRATTNKTRGSNAKWGGEKDRLKTLQGEYNHLLDLGGAELRTEALLGLLPHIQAFVSGYADQRRKHGHANFDDLLFWARDVLLSSAAARRYFHDRFRAVLIDEFQDTDPVQAELALLLTSDPLAGQAWRTLRPVTARLTVVGDPKQSIYRFRRADTEVYDQVRTVALEPGTEQISTNFRSNPALLECLNAVFDRLLVASPGIQAANVRLEAPANAPAARRPPVVVAEADFVGDADHVRSFEASVIARLLHTAHEDGWEIRDRYESDRWRPCSWGDMAILLPARTGVEHYEDALATYGIPYRHEGARDFFQREEVRDLIWVLSALDDPTDRLSLIGALRSSAFAVSDEQLVIHAAEAGALSYRSRAKGPSEPVNDALAELRELHRMRRGLSLPEFVKRVVERTRLVEVALTRRDGDQGAANLLAIVDDARLFSAAGGGGLRPFIRHLRTSMEQEAIEIEATVAEETDDVVRIMTIHGAKGLEYPIVALANLGGKESNQASPVPRESEPFLHFRVGALTRGRAGHFTTPGYADVVTSEKARVDAERLRLLYVAATRAREYLLVPCVVGRQNAPSLLGRFMAALPTDSADVLIVDAGEAVPPCVVEAPTAPISENDVAAAAQRRSAWEEARAALRRGAAREREIETASSRERAVGPLAAEVATFGASLVVSDGPPIPVGDAVHMIMERATLPDADDLEEIAEDVCLEGDIAEHLADVVSMCRSCLRSHAVQRALALGRWWREVPFLLSRAGTEAPDRGSLATGRVDMVYLDDGELVVIDYKTDRDVTEATARAHALEKHSGQAEIYAQALGAAAGLPVREVAFVYCKAGVEVRLRDGAVVG